MLHYYVMLGWVHYTLHIMPCWSRYIARARTAPSLPSAHPPSLALSALLEFY